MLFFHGNAGNISHRLESLKIFHDLGLGSFIYDYRGYGKSSGEPKEKDILKDAQTIYNYVVKYKESDPRKIISFGRSLGGSIAAYVAANNEVGALIAESSFLSVADMANDIYFFVPGFLAREKYETKKYIKDVKAPILIVHSKDDDIVPFKHGKKLFELANGEKEFLEIKGSHNSGFIESGDTYIEGLVEFLQK